ncbi:MAG: diaminopimelate decarboxylase [bacterium]|nr:diaminopimelate decarboxylase [bacterium]
MMRAEIIRDFYHTSSPVFVYEKAILEDSARNVLSIPAPFGLTVRYAMKANPYPEILKVFKQVGIEIDASSGFEAEAAIKSGYSGGEILLTSQELPQNLKELVSTGVQFNATSLRQLRVYAEAFPGTEVSVRINPGIGSGHSNRTNVGGQTSSFGVWHEYIPEVLSICEQSGLTVKRVHTHIGSGSDPEVWQEAIKISLELTKSFVHATVLNLGGGFKVARMPEEKGADMLAIGGVLKRQLENFYDETGRKLHLELEPGTFLVANAGTLLARVEDIVDTGTNGYNFIKINSGMHDILRPSLYGAQHPIEVLNDLLEMVEYVVVGHNCESGDLLTPAPGDPESLLPRLLNKAEIGDIVAIGGTGAYCASMSAHGYNGFPSAKEVMFSEN